MDLSEDKFISALKHFNDGRFDIAEGMLKDLVLLCPHHFDALQLLGIVLSIKNSYKEAIKYFDLALSVNEERADIWINKANALVGIKNFDIAIECLTKAINRDPNNFQARYCLAMSQLEMGRPYISLQIFQDLINGGERNIEILNGMGIALTKLKRSKEAIEIFESIERGKKSHPSIWCNEGIAFNALKQYGEAINCYDEAISLDPNFAQAWYNKGASLHDLMRYDEALACYDRALRIYPNYARAWSNKGVTYGALGRYKEALEFFEKAYQLEPSYAEAGWNQALMRLLLGDFLGAWESYECRWRKDDPHPYLYPNFSLLTNLQYLAGKTVLIWSEQGFGDTIHFSRYVPKLIALGANIIFEVQRPLVSLMNSIPSCIVVARGDVLPTNPEYQIPLLSLPALFGTNIDSIPAQIPYLKTSIEKVLLWRERLNLNKENINIGIACSGNSKHQNDLNRSMPLEIFSEVLKNERVQLFLIQKELRDSDRVYFEEQERIHWPGGEMDDFSDSAAIVENMDFIISVDTSLIHLAGALGKKAFLLLPWSPEWRWLLNRSDTPWYPSIEIFRQLSIGDWESAMREIALRLKDEKAGL